MASYALDYDLIKLIPGILGQGVNTFTPQLEFASNDVLNSIKSDWWPSAIKRRFALSGNVDMGPLLPTLDEAKLDVSVLVNLTCYRAFSRYIMPMLAKDNSPNDAWAAKILRYNIFYSDEWKKVVLLPLYDFNGDSQFSDIERRGPKSRRIMRA